MTANLRGELRGVVRGLYYGQSRGASSDTLGQLALRGADCSRPVRGGVERAGPAAGLPPLGLVGPGHAEVALVGAAREVAASIARI